MALSTEDSNDSQKRMRYYSPNPRVSGLFTHPTPVSPCLAQRGSDMRGSTVVETGEWFSRVYAGRDIVIVRPHQKETRTAFAH